MLARETREILVRSQSSLCVFFWGGGREGWDRARTYHSTRHDISKGRGLVNVNSHDKISRQHRDLVLHVGKFRPCLLVEHPHPRAVHGVLGGFRHHVFQSGHCAQSCLESLARHQHVLAEGHVAVSLADEDGIVARRVEEGTIGKVKVHVVAMQKPAELLLEGDGVKPLNLINGVLFGRHFVAVRSQSSLPLVWWGGEKSTSLVRGR